VFLFSTPLAIAAAVAITAVFSLFVTMVVMKRLFAYRYRDQIWDLMPPLLLSCVMAAAVLAVSRVPLSDLLSLVAQIVCGVAVYLGLAVLLKLQSFEYLWQSVKGYLNKDKTTQKPE
jgi:uncharacterized protein involved in response to NO